MLCFKHFLNGPKATVTIYRSLRGGSCLIYVPSVLSLTDNRCTICLSIFFVLKANFFLYNSTCLLRVKKNISRKSSFRSFFPTDTKTLVSNQDMHIRDPCLQKESLSFHCPVSQDFHRGLSSLQGKQSLSWLILQAVFCLQILEAPHAGTVSSLSTLRCPPSAAWVSFPKARGEMLSLSSPLILF